MSPIRIKRITFVAFARLPVWKTAETIFQNMVFWCFLNSQPTVIHQRSPLPSANLGRNVALLSRLAPEKDKVFQGFDDAGLGVRFCCMILVSSNFELLLKFILGFG